MAKTREELGFCGADCEECNIYRKMWFGEELKPETLRRWQEDAREYWHVDSLTPNDLNCKGCRNDYEGLFFGFTLCPIKKCCGDKGFSSCGMCNDLDTCQWVDAEGRKNLEDINAAGK
jgi:hypothetical protein